jgi:hypothetical protein
MAETLFSKLITPDAVVNKKSNRCRYLRLIFFCVLYNENEVFYYLGKHYILSSSILSFLFLALAVVFNFFGGSA